MYTGTPLIEATGTFEGYPIKLGTTPGHLAQAPKLKLAGGKIVMVSVGASVQNQISERIEARIGELTNPKFKFVNLCQPAKDINDWLDDPSIWTEVSSRMSAAGVSYSQVQSLWLGNDLLNTDAATFPSTPVAVKDALIELINVLKAEFPKLKHIFLAARPYSDWSDDIKHMEPKGYYNGWSCRWVVEDQIAGLIPFNPWICDVLYGWTDGTTMRSDGLQMLESDYNADGIHLSGAGKIKLGDWTFEKLKTNSVSSKYFY